MPTVLFKGNLFGPDCRVEVADGGRLVDVCDRVQAPVPFSCRAATCGTCRIEVLEGLEFFEPREGAEAELLDLLGDPPSHRLACQAKLRPEDGLIRLCIADDEI
ncbi:MAG TPA: 2Fe-2S iron-sulfur cluster-binding protein [Polyangiaceae bacterium]|jgi:2Fe-2S ferredoxin|nr:2Fe-2S iron-sulfur cluster-binding protein [Polyangiaceae bacterium]